jgi:hypothetical protein
VKIQVHFLILDEALDTSAAWHRDFDLPQRPQKGERVEVVKGVRLKVVDGWWRLDGAWSCQLTGLFIPVVLHRGDRPNLGPDYTVIRAGQQPDPRDLEAAGWAHV